MRKFNFSSPKTNHDLCYHEEAFRIPGIRICVKVMERFGKIFLKVFKLSHL